MGDLEGWRGLRASSGGQRVDWITTATGLAGVGGFATGGISLLVTLREKRRRPTVTLRWGIDPTYEKTSGLVLWIVTMNRGYQPIALNGLGLRVRGISGVLSALKPLMSKELPLTLTPGQDYATSLSSEVLLDQVRVMGLPTRVAVRGNVQTAFEARPSRSVTIDFARLRSLVSLVKGDANYANYKDFLRPQGGLIVPSFDEMERTVRAIVKDGLQIQTVPELLDTYSGE